MNDTIIFGPAAGIALSHVSLSLAKQPSESERLLSTYIGVTVAPFAWPCRGETHALCRELADIRITPHAALAATHLRGLTPGKDAYAFSYSTVTAARVSYPLLAQLRPFVLWRRGDVTMERDEAVPYGRDIVNYIGTGTTVGFGIEIPMVKSGRGLELSVSRITGRFVERELWDKPARLKSFVPANVPFRAVTLHLGWSGPFTGASLPWQ